MTLANSIQRSQKINSESCCRTYSIANANELVSTKYILVSPRRLTSIVHPNTQPGWISASKSVAGIL